MVWLPELGIFNVRTDVDACDCTQGCSNAVRESICTGSRLWEKNPLPHRGLEAAPVLRLAFQWDDRPAELIPAPGWVSMLLYGCDSDDD